MKTSITCALLALTMLVGDSLGQDKPATPYDAFRQASEAVVGALEDVSGLTKRQAEELKDLRTVLGEIRYEMSSIRASQDSVDRRLSQLENVPPPKPDTGGGDKDFVTAESWDQVASLVAADNSVRIDQIVTVTSPATLASSRALKFGPLGALRFSGGHRIVLDLPIINEDNHRIFLDCTFDEGYPARWNAGAASVTGTFGGEYTRDPRWWGLTTSDNPSYASLAQAKANNDAIAACALSRHLVPVTIQLPGGRVPICRTIRLDGLRATIRGAGAIGITGTRLWCHSEVWQFDVSHVIKTEHYPEGSTPVIEIGFERQRDKNPDEGFQCGVENLALTLPLNNVKPISGIMWESGLQEVSTIRYVAVSNYSGYAIGGPTLQHQEHNDPTPSGYLPQVNTVVMEKIWVASPNTRFLDCVGVSVFGLNFDIRNLTVSHQNGAGEFRRPAVILASRTAGRLSQIHIEHRPPRGVDAAAPGILIPNDRGAGRIAVDGAYVWLSSNLYPDTKSEVVRIDNPAASVSLTNINHRTGTTDATLNKTVVCVNDVARGRQSGAQYARASGKVLAHYARQYHFADGTYGVVSTDPALR